MRRVIERYHGTDGQPGWVFSIDREGRPIDGKRDLYAHAFVLFALAHAMRIERDPAFAAAVEATLGFIDTAFADVRHGGFWDCLPRPDALRRQNPHMHLFEALIALHEATGRADILARGRALRDLAITRFLDLETGAVREYFEDDWRVHPVPGAGSVEPGHLFEWAWLLRRWQAVSGEDETAAVAAILRFAAGRGLDAACGRIVDEIGEDGRTRSAASRSWPHAEALKALATEAMLAADAPDPAVAAILTRLLDLYCRGELAGGWVDHCDEADRPISKVMPASTLYHLYFGLTSVVDLIWRRGEHGYGPSPTHRRIDEVHDFERSK
jgi:mannose-6-phosphate isomerase